MRPQRIVDIFQPRSLQQRSLLFILVPTLLIFLVVGLVSFFLVRNVLLDQWQQTALTKLENSARLVDGRLQRMKRLLSMLQGEAGKEMNRQVSHFLMERIRTSEGVVDAHFEWLDDEGNAQPDSNRVRSGFGQRGSRMMYHRVERLDVTKPAYDEEFNGETVMLASEFRDKDNKVVGRLAVKIAFYDLIGSLVQRPWWNDYELFLVDRGGNVLTRTALIKDGDIGGSPGKLGSGSLEKRTMKMLEKEEQGIILGEGMPPEQISGFYHLKEAPWALVVIVPGSMVLEPIMKFRVHYLLTGLVGLVFALWLIRRQVNVTTGGIKSVTEAAAGLARGEFGRELEITSRDEVGELTRSFNIMTSQLRERMELQKAMSIAREVQQNLLPRTSFESGALAVAGASVYCDETGGDYFDLLTGGDEGPDIRVVVGDVVGHGIGAALLMATVRALVRSSMRAVSNPSDGVGMVNRLLCRDTASSGNFVSLFYLQIDQKGDCLEWVRCGHDPAIVYDPEGDDFFELKGDGLVLGVDESWQYTGNRLDVKGRNLVILVGSDGVWEAENRDKEQFGRQRVKGVLRSTAKGTPQEIIAALNREVSAFRGEVPQNDDITLVVVKIDRDANRHNPQFSEDEV